MRGLSKQCENTLISRKFRNLQNHETVILRKIPQGRPLMPAAPQAPKTGDGFPANWKPSVSRYAALERPQRQPGDVISSKPVPRANHRDIEGRRTSSKGGLVARLSLVPKGSGMCHGHRVAKLYLVRYTRKDGHNYPRNTGCPLAQSVSGFRNESCGAR